MLPSCVSPLRALPYTHLVPCQLSVKKSLMVLFSPILKVLRVYAHVTYTQANGLPIVGISCVSTQVRIRNTFEDLIKTFAHFIIMTVLFFSWKLSGSV